MTRGWALGAAVLMAAGCAGPGMPIPVQGPVEPLVGHWVGEYRSPDTGRDGSIVFTLSAGADTAWGDVVMMPADYARNPQVTPNARIDRPGPQVLRISFVRCEGNEITGWIDPYPDPDTGEQVRTAFDGVIQGNELRGTFTSYLVQSSRRVSGTWSVRRK